MVWWDPRTLTLAPPANLGLRQEEILKGDPNDEGSPSLIAYREWKEQREKTIAAGAGKAIRYFHRDRSARNAPADTAVAVSLQAVDKAAGRSAGPRFGTLVHTILRDVSLERRRHLRN